MTHKEIGVVVSTKMQKTIVVSIESRMRHPMYKKVITKHRRFKAHCEIEVAVGDQVEIAQTRPISKDVHFVVTRKVEAK